MFIGPFTVALLPFRIVATELRVVCPSVLSEDRSKLCNVYGIAYSLKSSAEFVSNTLTCYYKPPLSEVDSQFVSNVAAISKFT